MVDKSWESEEEHLQMHSRTVCITQWNS